MSVLLLLLLLFLFVLFLRWLFCLLWGYFFGVRDGFYRSVEWRRLRSLVLAENRRRYGLMCGENCCERCGRVVRGRRVHCDHVYPRSRYVLFGLMRWNLQVLCGRCNRMKSDRRGYHWRFWRRLGLHPLVWWFRWRQERRGLRRG